MIEIDFCSSFGAPNEIARLTKILSIMKASMTAVGDFSIR